MSIQFPRFRALASVTAAIMVFVIPLDSHSKETVYLATLKSPGGDLNFELRLDLSKPSAVIVNGSEPISDIRTRRVGGTVDMPRVELAMPYYAARIQCTVLDDGEQLQGEWIKRAGANKTSRLGFHARRNRQRRFNKEAVQNFVGRWKVLFSSSDEPAIGIFKASNDGGIYGTFLTTTGDYRYLAGGVVDGQLELSVFDGAHAFLFHAKHNSDGTLEGDFWSRDTWHETWTAKRDDEAQLPDAFTQTKLLIQPNWSEFSFPDVKGNHRSIADEDFSGQVKLVHLFGSWCPNCHDAASYLNALHETYADDGLVIVGLAFELTGDAKMDIEQVQRYVERHDTKHTVLIAGIADKKKASEKFKFLDRVRSFPTTLFLDSKNEIVAVHTGFSGPATGEPHERLKNRYKQVIERLLNR